MLLINSDNLNVPYALPTQLSDTILTSETSAYARAFFGLFCNRFILKDLDHFMTSLYTSLMAHQQISGSSGAKHHVYFSAAPNTAYADITADGDAEPSATPDCQEWNLLRQSYCYLEPCTQNRETVI